MSSISFLSVEQLAGYGRFGDDRLDRAVLERFFFLDDADRVLVAKRRGDHSRLGFAVQLVTVRYLGAFLVDPVDVPIEVIDYVAGQIGVADPSCVKQYLRRHNTRWEHQSEIVEGFGLVSFTAMEPVLVEWLDAEAWTTGAGPRALFNAAVGWCRERSVLLPGVTTLAELVVAVRQACDDRLYAMLASAVTVEQAGVLDGLLEVPGDRRRSRLDRWRHGERSTTGRGMVLALDRVAQIAGLGMRDADIGGVPTRRVIELARYGMAAKAPKLARHPSRRRVATMLATVRWLEVTAVDDALELFDVFMSNELIGRAAKTVDKQTLRRQSGFVRDATMLKTAVDVLFDAAGEWGDDVSLAVGQTPPLAHPGQPPQRLTADGHPNKTAPTRTPA